MYIGSSYTWDDREGDNDSLCNNTALVILVLGPTIRPRRCRSAAAYSHQTFPWMICRSVRLSSALWNNGGSDPDAVWHHRSDGSRDEASSAVWGSVTGRGTFGDTFGARHCILWELYGVRINRRSCGFGWCLRWAEALLY